MKRESAANRGPVLAEVAGSNPTTATPQGPSHRGPWCFERPAQVYYAQDQVVVDGSFSKGGKKARGWFTVEDAGCSTRRQRLSWR